MQKIIFSSHVLITRIISDTSDKMGLAKSFNAWLIKLVPR